MDKSILNSSILKKIPFEEGKVRYFLSDELLPEDEARQKVAKLSELESLVGLAALPDLHVKEENPFPTGTAFATDKMLYPFGVGKRIGCGMRLVKTSLSADLLTSAKKDEFFQLLKALLPDMSADRVPPLKKDELYELVFHGAEWASHKYGRPSKECQCVEENGSYFKRTTFTKNEVKKYLPADAVDGGITKYGFLGAVGNHFFELQKVNEIIDPVIASAWGLTPGQLVFMIHCDSGAFSKRSGIYYNKLSGEKRWDKQVRHFFRKLAFHFGGLNFSEYQDMWRASFKKDSLSGIPQDTEAARQYMAIAYAAANYCIVNRTVLTGFVEKALRETFKNLSVDTELLYDVSHETVKQETIDGRSLWIHRNGASCAWPKEAFDATSPYRQTGQPLLMPGAMGQDSFICASDSGVKNAWYSVNHGAGRKLKKSLAKSMFTEEGVHAKLKAREIKLYKLFSEDVVTQGPDSYKNIDEIIQAVQAYRLAKPVARLTPLAVLKG
jgi:tRNA-splicing ligase RtcB